MLYGRLPTTRDIIEAMCRRLRCSSQRRELSLLANELLDTWPLFEEQSAEQLAALIFAADGLRKQERFATFAEIADDMLATRHKTKWLQVITLMSTITAASITSPLKGPELGRQIREAQIEKLRQVYQ